MTLGAVLAQGAAVFALAALTPAQGAPLNAALLLLATTTLGGVWALRKHLRLRAGAQPNDSRQGSPARSDAGARPGAASPCLSAGLVPFIAGAFFLLPRLYLGPASAALSTLALAALAAPLLERAWARWVLPEDDAARPARAALATGAPLMAVGLASAGPSPLSWALLALAGALAAALGGWAHRRTRAALAESARFADALRSVEVGPGSLRLPEIAPPPMDTELRELDRALRERAEVYEHEAQADAKAREEVADARALRTRFMAAMGHELRSPLNSILGFVQVLERGLDGELTEDQRESITMIHRSADELMLLLTDVLDLARLEAGKLRLRRQWTPSVEILTEAVSRGQTIVEGRDVRLEAELQPGLPPVHVDSKRIVQAVVAMFRNAASSLSRTTIRLRARIAYGPPGPASHLRVEIYDAIGAIPEADVERIFEAFQEITEPTGRRVGGLGMALSLSRGLVRLHGGEVWAEIAPGHGTVLCVAIPLESAEETG